MSFMVKFSKSIKLISSGAIMVSVAKFPVMQSLQRVPKISSFEPKFQRESENQCCFKVSEKVSKHNIKKMGFLKKKNLTHDF